MKNRSCFVSNSSTCSFCVFGYCVSSKDIGQEFVSELFADDESRKASNSELKSSRHNTFDRCESDDTFIYVGLSPDNMKTDETRQQFEDRVKRTVVDVMGKEYANLGKPYFIEMGWEDR